VARTPSPWFWEERAEWCVNLHGQRRKLGPHPDGYPAPKKFKGKWNIPEPILRQFHQLMAQPAPKPNSPRPPATDDPAVAGVLDKYLDWCLKNRARRTYDWYKDNIQSFLDSLPDAATMTVRSLKPFHVIEWADSHADWSSTTRRGAIVAIQRPFNWAAELGYIDASPIKRIRKPPAQRRDNPITPADFTELLAKVKQGDPFRDLLNFAWHTGCRPQEARHVEARHVNLDGECVVIPSEEAKGKRRPRIIYLNAPALEIVRRLVQDHPQGKLFRNANGNPWKRFAIACRFDRLRLAFGREKLRERGISPEPLPRFNRHRYEDKAQLSAARQEHQKRLRARRKQLSMLARQHSNSFAAYDLRHGFCQRMLENGANHLAVAELMGHTNGQMVSQVYSHMNRANGHLKDTLKKASGEDVGV
jgi:integrase